MKKRFKLSIIIATILAVLTFSGCMIIPDNSASDFSGNGLGTINVTVNVETATENQYSSLTEMLDEVRPSVVEIYVSSSTAIGTGVGSGVIVSSVPYDDYTVYYILTCHHVINGNDSIVIKDIDGNQFNAGLIGGDPKSDTAVLSVGIANNQTKNLAVAKVRDIANETTPLKVGEDAVAIGNPLGTLGGTVTKGIISSISRTVSVEGKKMQLIQTDCASNPGNSGGGLFDIQGRLVGITNSGFDNFEGLNFAVPINDALLVYESLMETYFSIGSKHNFGYVEGRANVAAENAYALSFGYDIAFADYSTNMFNYYTYVMAIRQGSVYQKAGFRVGDYVTAVSVDGQKSVVEGPASSALVNYLNSLDIEINDQITFTVVRNGVQMNLTVTYKQFIYGDTGMTKPN